MIEEQEWVATIPKTGPPAYSTATGLSVPGATASYEGSEPVAVTRPA